jgi:hypothetical protein
VAGSWGNANGNPPTDTNWNALGNEITCVRDYLVDQNYTHTTGMGIVFKGITAAKGWYGTLYYLGW